VLFPIVSGRRGGEQRSGRAALMIDGNPFREIVMRSWDVRGGWMDWSLTVYRRLVSPDALQLLVPIGCPRSSTNHLAGF